MGFPVRQSYKTVLVWGVLIIVLYAVYVAVMSAQREQRQPIDFSQFLARLDKGEVEFVRIKDQQEFTGNFTDGQKFQSIGVMSDQVLLKLSQSKARFEIEKDEQNSLLFLVLNWLPMVFLIVLFFIFMRQLQAGGGKAMSFGKARARLLSEHQKKVTFADVAGVDEAKAELEEIIQFLKDPKKFTRLGGRIPKGVLLMGPPGTGKTLLARAIAGEAGVPFFSISGSDFVEMFVGVGASRVRDLFEQGKKNAPCIIFVDEIDAVGRHRGAGLGGGHDEREQTLNQLLVEMDGFESNDGVVLIAGTNRPDVLDPALLRPGRFDRRIVVPRPDLTGREQIFRVHTRKVPLSSDVDLAVLARGTPGFCGADIENLVNEAALVAARGDKTKVEMEDFESAKDRVLMGSERRSMIITEKEKQVTAYHEAGHALVAKNLPSESDPVHKVTIIPHGMALGATMQLPTDDRHNLTKQFAENRIAITMGGRIAEEIVFGEITTGAGNDIDQATELARKMVCEWGMSERLGPLSFGKHEEAIFLGRDFAQRQDYSESTAVQIDEEVRRIVTANYQRAKDLLLAHREALERIAQALLEYETLNGDDVDRLMRGESLDRARPTKKLRTREDVEREEAEKKKLQADSGSGQSGILGPLPEPGKA
ncbi:MAG: ATP-dependent zinc metalloprotease FtsH [Deltaproteobacteria bacterium]|nr:ATP-dependent zinc metalloprotease FtsH [Deltaproteobacteria bacterium]